MLHKKSILHYTRDITPKRLTSGVAHLRGAVLGPHSSEQTSQRWRAVGDTVTIWPTRQSNLTPTAPIRWA